MLIFIQERGCTCVDKRPTSYAGNLCDGMKQSKRQMRRDKSETLAYNLMLQTRLHLTVGGGGIIIVVLSRPSRFVTHANETCRARTWVVFRDVLYNPQGKGAKL